MKIARVGVLLDRTAAERRWLYGLNVFERWIGELLAHAGVPFEWLDQTRQVLEQGLDIVIAALPGDEKDDLETLLRYAARGGVVVTYGGINGLARKLGFRRAGRTGPGYAALTPELGEERQLRFLASEPWIARGDTQPAAYEAIGSIAPEPGEQSSLPMLLRIPVERGCILRWSIDIIATIVGLQQGTAPLFEDGAPAADGSAGLDDGMLKAEDSLTLDWRLDRAHTDAGVPYFAYPYADWWKETLVGQLLRCAVSLGRTLPFLSYWPDGVDSVAMISHDSDRNHDEDAETTLRELAASGVVSTWCMMKPGYSAYMYDRIRDAGHELALHFNSNRNEGGNWSEAEFRRQCDWLRQTVESETISNKNHFTRFEGWGELYRWCEACGVASDQTRGPSKRGSVGFPFGTCQPYFPIAWADERNRMYDVLEIGFLTQDFGAMTDFSAAEPLLRQVARVHGVAHVLFHQGRIHSDPAVKESFRRFVQLAKAEGFVFWTGKQINDWERRRRLIAIAGLEADGQPILRSLQREKAYPDGIMRYVVWVPLADSQSSGEGERTERQFGVLCRRIVCEC